MNKLVTNFDLKSKPRYKKALAIYEKQTKDMSLYIDEKAYWTNGIRDRNMNSVMGNSTNNYKIFWDILLELDREGL